MSKPIALAKSQDLVCDHLDCKEPTPTRYIKTTSNNINILDTKHSKLEQTEAFPSKSMIVFFMVR